MKVSQSCVELIKDMEGCKLTAYLDTLAVPHVWTIGYGHTGPDVYEGRVMTQKEADDTLLDRLNNEYGPGVERALRGTPCTQGQFDAFVSFSYNVGVGGFTGSSVLRLHRDGNFQAAANAFLLWNRAGGVVYKGLTRRRQAERTMYLSSSPVATNAYDRYKCAKEIQMALMGAGLYSGTVDGKWGRLSRAAYDAFDPEHKEV